MNNLEFTLREKIYKIYYIQGIYKCTVLDILYFVVEAQNGSVFTI